MDKRTRELMHSSENMEEETPQDFFDQLNSEFKFTIDLAANKKNAKCKRYLDEKANALEVPWPKRGRGWLNPPYGRGVIHWVGKAAVEAQQRGVCVVMLLVPRTDTKWFEIAADTADEIRFIKGRLQFEGQPNKAPFPSCLVIWYGDYRVKPIVPIDDDEYSYNLIWRR